MDQLSDQDLQNLMARRLSSSTPAGVQVPAEGTKKKGSARTADPGAIPTTSRDKGAPAPLTHSDEEGSENEAESNQEEQDSAASTDTETEDEEPAPWGKENSVVSRKNKLQKLCG